MAVNFELRHALSPTEYMMLDTDRLREEFLIENLMSPGDINLVYSEWERFIVGGATPTADLTLEPVDILKSDTFLARREIGMLNVGGAGSVVVDGTEHAIDFKEALYIGQGAREVIFRSADAAKPAHFYFCSAPAHRAIPLKKMTKKEAVIVELGSAETSNHRMLNKMLVNDCVETCQLQMGLTEILTGSCWNTMPAHTHNRRNEVYFYFEVPEDQAVCHLMGPPDETRNIWVHNMQAVISPPWSIHCGAGTSNYSFIWAMAGENLNYGDMDIQKITDLK